MDSLRSTVPALQFVLCFLAFINGLKIRIHPSDPQLKKNQFILTSAGQKRTTLRTRSVL